MITKKWGKYTFHLERLNAGTMMLLEDLAYALGMSWYELKSKIRDDFLVERHTEGDQDVPAGSYTFVTRGGVYQAFLLAQTAEAIEFQNYVFELIYLNNIGPAWSGDFDLLDPFAPKEPDRSRLIWVYTNIVADAWVADRFNLFPTPFYKLKGEHLSYREYIFPHALRSVKEDVKHGRPVRLPHGFYELSDPDDLYASYDLELRKRGLDNPEYDLS